MSEVLERIARERVASLEQESAALTGETEGFLLFSRENCAFVDLLSFLWKVMIHRLRVGGGPAKFFVEECDLLLALAEPPRRFFSAISRVWQQRELPGELAEPIHAEVQSSLSRLDHLEQEVHTIRKRLAKAPTISADPGDLNQRVEQADERQEWLPLRDVVARMRQNAPAKQE